MQPAECTNILRTHSETDDRAQNIKRVNINMCGSALAYVFNIISPTFISTVVKYLKKTHYNLLFELIILEILIKKWHLIISMLKNYKQSMQVKASAIWDPV